MSTYRPRVPSRLTAAGHPADILAFPHCIASMAFERAGHFLQLGTLVRRLICSLMRLKDESGSSYKTVCVF